MKKRAQSTLELVAVITFVTVGVLIIGPTVIRSVNAHFKLWDDSIQDSYSDPMNKAPRQDNPNATCTCTPFQGSSPAQCGVSPCGATEYLQQKLCTPPDCDYPTTRCQQDSACCNVFKDTPLCGMADPNKPVCDPNTPVTAANASCDCPIGQRIISKGCGMNTTRFGCRTDSDPVAVDGNPSCSPICLGQYAQTAAGANRTLPIICDQDDVLNPVPTSTAWQRDPNGVTGLPITLTGVGVSTCTANKKCEVYCTNGSIPNSSGTACFQPCDKFVTGISFSNICPDDKGSLSLNYGTGTLSASNGDIHGSVTLSFSDNTTQTVNYDCSNKGCSFSTQLPGNWSLIQGMDITASGYGRNGGGTDNNPSAKTTGFHWDDDGPTSCPTYNVYVNNLTVSAVPPSAQDYSKTCTGDAGEPLYCDGADQRVNCTDTGNGRNHWITLLSPNGCAAWEGPANYGSGGCRLDCTHSSCSRNDISCNWGGENYFDFHTASTRPWVYINCNNNKPQSICINGSCSSRSSGGGIYCDWSGKTTFYPEVNGNDDLTIDCEYNLVVSMCSGTGCSAGTGFSITCDKSSFISDWCDGNDLGVVCSSGQVTQINASSIGHKNCD